MKPSLPVYLIHIEEAIANIESDIEGYDYKRFCDERQARQLAERNLEIISEASRRIPDSLKEQEPNIPWKEIAGIGNMLRHDYHQRATGARNRHMAICPPISIHRYFQPHKP